METAAPGQREQSLRPKTAPSSAQAVDSARAARRTARLQRAHALQSRETARRQCLESIQIVWRARQLCFDRHGPILAMLDGVIPDQPDEAPGLLAEVDPLEPTHNFDSIALASMAIERLFGVGLTLASCRSAIGDVAGSDRVDRAMDDIDLLIRDLRTAVFAQGRDADSARSELRQSLPHLIDLANIAQADGPATADHLNLTHTLQRALLELDWITG